MIREDFERLRDLSDKVISGDIKLVQPRDLAPLWIAEKIRIENSEGVDARLTIDFNVETDAKCLNVHIPGIGPICRLEVDSRSHRPFGRSHKHSLETAACPAENLKKKVRDYSQLSGRSIHEVFAEFCKQANIQHNGQLLIGYNG